MDLAEHAEWALDWFVRLGMLAAMLGLSVWALRRVRIIDAAHPALAALESIGAFVVRLAPAAASFFVAEWTWRALHGSEPLLRDIAAWTVFATGVVGTVALLARHLRAIRSK